MKTRLWIVIFCLMFLAASSAGPISAGPPSQSLTGLPVKGNGSAVYRLMENGELRHISDWATFLALGYQPGQIVTLPQEEIAAHALGLPLTRWVTGETDTGLYFLLRGQRVLIPDARTLQITGGDALNVVPLSDDYLHSFPLSPDLITITDLYTPPDPAITGAVWSGGALWVADDSGQLRRWQDQAWIPTGIPGVFSALTANGDQVYAGTTFGAVWQISGDDSPLLLQHGAGEWITALEITLGGVWTADTGYYDWEYDLYVPGLGINLLGDQAYTPQRGRGDGGIGVNLGRSKQRPYIKLPPLTPHSITALALDPQANVLWIGTHGGGLARYDLAAQTTQQFTMFNSALPDHTISDLALDEAGTLWITTPSRLSKLVNGQIEIVREGIPSSSLALAADGSIWLSGENALGRLDGPIYTAFDHPLLRDSFDQVVLDDQQTPWFVGRKHLIHFDGQSWTAYDTQTGAATPFDPTQPELPFLGFITPYRDYVMWLKTWPRPADDNGRCMHYLQYPAGDSYEIWEQITRLERLGVRWALVNYTSPAQLVQMAPIFARANITVIWRPFVRPYQEYHHWAQDVTFLRAMGLPPYIQVYNEPSLAQEWDGQPIDQALYLDHMMAAAHQVDDAGGYVGLQQIDLDWTRAMLQRLKAEGFDLRKTFFVPHPYGANHPPDYREDPNGVLSFLDYARVFEQEIGFVPPMIAGEGGWRLGENADTRYPPITEELHRDFNVAVFDWFRTGQLSNGDPLPDYLFAFCPWLLSDPADPAAWYDSASGNRQLTIEAVEALPDFERRFGWDQ